MDTAVATDGPRISSFNLTNFGKLPIKLYTWASWEKTRVPYSGESEGYLAHLKPVAVDFLNLVTSAYSSKQINLPEVERNHDAGFAFLYGDENEAKQKTVGLEMFLFRKKENWADNTMVDSYGFDVDISSFALGYAPNKIPSENCISCNQGLRVAGIEANLRAASKSKEEYISMVSNNIPEKMLLPELHQQFTTKTNTHPLSIAKRPGGPEVVAVIDTSFDQIPLKTIIWNSYLDIMISKSISRLKESVEFEQNERLLHWFYGADDLNKNHDSGISFLYGYVNKAKQKVIGVGLVLFQKTKRWSDNPMVDARVIELAVTDDMAEPKKIPGQDGIMCNAEMRIAGEMSALRDRTASLQEFVSTPITIPADLLSSQMRRERTERIKVS